MSLIDISFMLESASGYAVRCSNKDEATMFVCHVREVYPHLAEKWKDGEVNFHFGPNTVYTFDTRLGGKWRQVGLMYGLMNAVIGSGYKVIEFSAILTEPDINESGESIDALFG